MNYLSWISCLSQYRLLMPILNYTTSIDAEKTATEIQKILVRHGARQVLMDYNEDGVMSSISFQIKTECGPIHFRLPVNIEGVHKVLTNEGVERRYRTYEQAARVAWRIIKDWVEAQLAIVEAGQAEIMEVFLPYALNPQGQTVYEVLENKGFKQLTWADETK